jgi:hypothetical protein
VNDFVMRAAALALRDTPAANAFWDKHAEAAVQQPSVDVCVAVATDGGLITPIVKAADTKTLTQVGNIYTIHNLQLVHDSMVYGGGGLCKAVDLQSAPRRAHSTSLRLQPPFLKGLKGEATATLIAELIPSLGGASDSQGAWVVAGPGVPLLLPHWHNTPVVMHAMHPFACNSVRAEGRVTLLLPSWGHEQAQGGGAF